MCHPDEAPTLFLTLLLFATISQALIAANDKYVILALMFENHRTYRNADVVDHFLGATDGFLAFGALARSSGRADCDFLYVLQLCGPPSRISQAQKLSTQRHSV